MCSNGNCLPAHAGQAHWGRELAQIIARQLPRRRRAMFVSRLPTLLIVAGCTALAAGAESPLPSRTSRTIAEDAQFVRIETPELAAAIRKKGYVSGVAGQSFLDKKTGFRDPGFGLDIVDWIMEPGSDAAYRDRLDPELIYRNEGEYHLYHGSRPKRSLEGPQICTKAGALQPSIIRGKDFVAIRQQFTYRTAAPGKKAGSVWTQVLVFPAGQALLHLHGQDRRGQLQRGDVPAARHAGPCAAYQGRHVQRGLSKLSRANSGCEVPGRLPARCPVRLSPRPRSRAATASFAAIGSAIRRRARTVPGCWA